jgi:hypothetical protein
MEYSNAVPDRPGRSDFIDIWTFPAAKRRSSNQLID